MPRRDMAAAIRRSAASFEAGARQVPRRPAGTDFQLLVAPRRLMIADNMQHLLHHSYTKTFIILIYYIILLFFVAFFVAFYLYFEHEAEPR
jgi:hypothetical protein